MQTITTIGLDIAKSVFQVHGVYVSTDNPVEYSKNRLAKGGKKLLTSLLGFLGENLAQNASAKSTICCLRKFRGRPVLLTRALRAASRIFVSVGITSALSNSLA